MCSFKLTNSLSISNSSRRSKGAFQISQLSGHDGKCLLVLGTSHVGKSTCSQALAKSLGWSVHSTDTLGRHPGRPWSAKSEYVSDFYINLSDDAIYWFLCVHYENMRKHIHQHVANQFAMNSPFVLEGSALRPEYLSECGLANAPSVCLYADNKTLRDRIRISSGYSKMSKRSQTATDKFIERSIRDSNALVESCLKHELSLIDVSDISNRTDLMVRVSEVLGVKC